ncbi:Copper binding protein, plastocyanin/azurin family [Cyclobacterium xiamenense]|uniref:Copper binding protein, plastocyanin/azurin family n=1 Tax=Cyclobacterium xiamenense TaxID=1297121 RepID=A0A1H7A6G4_9BACT|nr:plastocyanin/azurin family copper-binding protein [Cyclobacterium xiamenense]SEJ61018.1 Copper binding protein, plastocyanin/azurin family [Cyclobacterium xiamenense]
MKGIALACLGSILITVFFLVPPDSGWARIAPFVDSAGSVGEKYTASADTTEIEIVSKGVELSYSVSEIRAKAGEVLRIRYINESDMSHNIVLVREEADIRPVGIAALQAMATDWIPEKEMHRILAYSDLAYSGDTVVLSFNVPPPGTYPYICTYSAHWTQMQGRLISTE